MRRRRQKNTLLPKMIGIAVLVNAILLPILAQLGVFRAMKGHQHLIPVQIVQAPPPPPKPKVHAKKAHPKVAHHAPAHHAAPRAATHLAHANVTHLKLATAAPGAGGGSGPVAPVYVPPGPAASPSAPPPVSPPPVIAPTPAPVTPPPPKPAPPVAPPPVEPPPIPVLAQATVAHQVLPQIPSGFSDSNLPVSFHAVFDIHADGTATVTIDQGTGDKTLDQLALAAARQWTFHPGTEDGKPVDSYLRLTINFVPGDESAGV